MNISTTLKIRKIATTFEQIMYESGQKAEPYLYRVAVTAVCENPCAGRYISDLNVLINGSVGVGQEISRIAADLMRPYGVQSYGKGAIVGINGELEHAEAVLTTVFGDTLREAVGGGKSWICHMAKQGLPSESIDIPLGHKDALTIRSHYDSMTVQVADSPMPHELAITCCFASRGRINHRIGGHSVEAMVGRDGLV